MIRVQAPSRLHFGLLSLPGADSHWPDFAGQRTISARHFGSVGLMIERPGLALTTCPSTTWSAEGPSAQRALDFARQVEQEFGPSSPCEIRIERCPPEHVGLGTGTQLGLAVGHAIAPSFPLERVAEATHRGQRSALGVWGFTHGGLLVDGGKAAGASLAPLICHHAFPEEWSVLLVIPAALQGVHGSEEHLAFSNLAADLRQTEALCRLVMLGMLPALVSRDLDTFGEALYDFNRRVGAMFHAWQGGLYAHPRVAQIVAWIRDCGIRGVGQSSWGPTVFAIVTPAEGKELTERLVAKHGLSEREVLLTTASRGAQVSRG